MGKRIKLIISIILIALISFFSFYFVLMGIAGYLLLFPIWVFCVIISVINLIRKKRKFILIYVLIFSIVAAFFGEQYVDYLNNYLEDEIKFLAKSIENNDKITDNKYNTSEIVIMLKKYNYDKIEFPYNNANDMIAINGFTRKPGKPLMNLTFKISDNYFSISGIMQLIGIPGMHYNSNEKIVHRGKGR